MFNRLFYILSVVFLGALYSAQALSFCGFYVAKADTELFNKASKVVMVRDGERSVITMASDFQGKVEDFAIVIPVPVALKKQQIHVTDNKLINHLDAYTAPRLVEYFDSDPCLQIYARIDMAMESPLQRSKSVQNKSAKALGVTIEESYTVGEYDILILSAKQSDGLQTWLDHNGYKIPNKARKVLSSYIKQGMKFFVAKVNIDQKDELGTHYLRPIQMAFESNKFMLPIRLGTVNAKTAQDMFVFALTKKGRVETTNYRTVKIPSNKNVPLFVKDKFSEFYTDMFSEQVKKENNKAVFLEYAWNMAWCDPCAADPLTNDQLRELGVFWLKKDKPSSVSLRRKPSAAPQVYVTRLHVRYDAENFPEDLKFQVTNNTENYQGRYILRHPWTAKSDCKAAENYRKELAHRYEKEAKNLAHLTGWNYQDIRKRMEETKQFIEQSKDEQVWWEKFWN